MPDLYDTLAQSLARYEEMTDDEKRQLTIDICTAAQPVWNTLNEDTKRRIYDVTQRVSRDENGWPLIYVNRETGRMYRPHNQMEREFVYSDDPRYCLCKGGEGCVAAETLIDGVPIAERVSSSLTTTVAGVAPAGPGYQKGRADLYRVRVQSGAEVTVTLEHRFLTPRGWSRLADLSVGDRLAGCDTQHALPATQRGVGFRDGCRGGSMLRITSC